MEAHDASTSKRYQAAAQEAQATIAKRDARIAALEATLTGIARSNPREWAHPVPRSGFETWVKSRALAALNHTEGKHEG